MQKCVRKFQPAVSPKAISCLLFVHRKNLWEIDMCNDPIVEEVRKARQAHAARFDYDLSRIYKDLKDSEQRSGRKIVSLAGSERMRKKAR